MPSGETLIHFPSKELGGKSLVSYFAGLLFDETLATYLIQYRESAETSPLFVNSEKILEENKRIDQQLRDLNLYFYNPDGSVFMDYKIMRKRKFPQDGSLGRWKESNIKLTTPSQQAFELCKKEVATWWNLK